MSSQCAKPASRGKRSCLRMQVYEDVASAEERCLAYAQLALAAAERQGYAAAEQVQGPPHV